MHVPRGCETSYAPHLAEGRKVDGEDDVRVVDHDPPQIAVYGHRLRHVAQLHAVGACEDLVLDGVRGGVVVGEGGVAVHEVALVDDEQTVARGFGQLAVTHVVGQRVVILHASGEREKRRGEKCACEGLYVGESCHVRLS